MPLEILTSDATFAFQYDSYSWQPTAGTRGYLRDFQEFVTSQDHVSNAFQLLPPKPARGFVHLPNNPPVSARAFSKIRKSSVQLERTTEWHILTMENRTWVWAGEELALWLGPAFFLGTHISCVISHAKEHVFS